MRGEVKNAQGNVLPYAKIRLLSKGAALFTSGASGSFGIPLSQKQDSITISLDGYKTLTQLISVSSFQSLIVTPAQLASEKPFTGLMSLTKSIAVNKPTTAVAYGEETYTSLAENSFVKASDAARTSIALNINCASYSNIRRFLNMKSVVPPDGVRIEEMLNYFNLNESKNEPPNGSFRVSSQLTSCPWKDNNRLLFINVQAPKLDYKNATPAKFIFLIDVSGSMDKDNRLPLVQAAFKFLVNNLREQDTVGIVTYGGYVGIALQPTSGAEKDKIDKVIDSLHADGDTPGSQAIQTAYQMAEKLFDAKSNNRVILATDGDFNIGQTSDKELQTIISRYKDKGIYLTCLGTGMGNYKDSRLEMLAKKGNGNFAYIDNLAEAQKTMVTEFTKNMYAVANNATLHIFFNDKAVDSYRLIGYDNRRDALKDTSLMEGGELGSGQNTLVVFEIAPTLLNEEPLASVEFYYHQPQNESQLAQKFIVTNRIIRIDSSESKLRMAAAVCMFGMMLKQSNYAVGYTWDTVANLARSAYHPDQVSEKELVELIEKAKNVYRVNSTDKKKRK